MRNFEETIRLLLPLVLRTGAKLRALLRVLTGHDVGDATRAEAETARLVEDHSYLGQGEVVRRLLRVRFDDSRIDIAYPEEDTVVIVSERGGERETWCGAEDSVLRVAASGTPTSETDFTVHITEGGDTEMVRAWLRRYVMAGISYDVVADLHDLSEPGDDDEEPWVEVVIVNPDGR